MDDHSDQSEIISSEEEHSDDSSPENFTDDSQESESSAESINYDSSDSDDNRSIPQCWTTLIDEAMGRHEVEVESFMEEYEQQAICGKCRKKHQEIIQSTEARLQEGPRGGDGTLPEFVVPVASTILRQRPAHQYEPETPRTARAAGTDWTPGCSSGLASGSSLEDLYGDKVQPLKVRKVKIANHVIVAHESAFSKVPAVYGVPRSVCKSFTIPGTTPSLVKDNVFNGQIPKRLIVFMNKSTATNGSYTSNPFNMDLFSISSIGVYVDGEQSPSKPLKLNLTGTNKMYLESFQTLFTGTGKYHDDAGNLITRDDYHKGYGFFVFDLRPDGCDVSEYLGLRKRVASNTMTKETINQNETQTTNNEVEAPTEAGSSREEAIVVPDNEESDEEEFEDEFEEYHTVEIEEEEEFDPFAGLDPDVRIKVYHLFGDILEVLR
ncbi:hypothetical protein QZH41_000390 [Actinostola sp. cb2023]|nr:hypothetical protein QZH41_000390 [Actinostola sp. cb2023]